MIVSKKSLVELVDRRIRTVITDRTIARSIAMEFLVGLSKAQLNRFNEAVELRRQSEAKLEKLDETAINLDDALASANNGLEFELQ